MQWQSSLVEVVVAEVKVEVMVEVLAAVEEEVEVISRSSTINSRR